MTDVTPGTTPEYELDPVYLSSRREARWIFCLWLACYIWTMTVCGSLGYSDHVDPETFDTILGIPFWVAVGVALPWLVANVFTLWFCLGFMKDHDLAASDSVDDGTKGHA